MNDEFAYEFIDTNLLVYAYDNQAGQKQTAAKHILNRLWAERTGCLSIQVLQEFYVVVTKKLSNPISAEQAMQIIADLGQWQVHQPAVADVLGAIQIQTKHKLSFWDSLIIRSAKQLKCGIIWTEDLNDGQRIEGCLIQTPFRST